ncbi:hypothetical protein DPMN_134017 [Dreissena polymorpha]|uniref:Uncharacterized protein n=1 Tax=Dreissena polymorpha TaxID=45954 RepID=A0A9D4FZD7_DREPO|nr:hypothetical protein DPMN_134017 [Dreissena polymorpha]
MHLSDSAMSLSSESELTTSSTGGCFRFTRRPEVLGTAEEMIHCSTSAHCLLCDFK